MPHEITEAEVERILADLRDQTCQRASDCEAFDWGAVACADSVGGEFEDEWREGGLPLRIFIAHDMAYRLGEMMPAMCAEDIGTEDEAESRNLGRAGERVAERLEAILTEHTTTQERR